MSSLSIQPEWAARSREEAFAWAGAVSRTTEGVEIATPFGPIRVVLPDVERRPIGPEYPGWSYELVRPASGTARLCRPLVVSPEIEAWRDAREAPGERPEPPEKACFAVVGFWERVRAQAMRAWNAALPSVERTSSARRAQEILRRALQGAVRQVLETLPAILAEETCRADEIELGWPELPGRIGRALKLRYARAVDGVAEIAATSKNRPCRTAALLPSAGLVSGSTGRAVPSYYAALNPMVHLDHPRRAYRELRAFVQGLAAEHPELPVPPAVPLAPEMAAKLAAPVVAFLDLPGLNVFPVNGRQEALDCLLVTPSGSRKLAAIEEEVIELPGRAEEGACEERRELVDVIGGRRVFRRSWVRRERRRSLCRYDKVKLVAGGVKGVGKPVDEQLVAELPDGRLLEIDLVVAETTVRSKQAWAAVMLALHGLLGLGVDPELDRAGTLARVQRELVARGFPEDGRVPVRTGSGERLGTAFVGPVAAIRAQETERLAADPGARPVLNANVRNALGIPMREDPELADRLRVLLAAYRACRTALA